MVDDDIAWTRLRTAFAQRAPLLAARIADRIADLDRTTDARAVPLGPDIEVQVAQLLAADIDSPAFPTTEEGRAHLQRFCTGVLRAGVPLGTVLRGLRIALEEGMTLTDAVAEETGVGAAARGRLNRHLLAWSDLAMSTAADTHHELIAPVPERFRRYSRLLGRIRAGDESPDDLDAVAAAGLGRDGGVLTLVARPGRPDRAASTVDELIGPNAIAAFLDDEVVALLPDPPRAIGGVVAGVGPRAAAGGLSASFRLADRALQTVVALGWAGVHSFDDLGMLPAVVADQEVGAALARRYLDPCLRSATGAVLLDTVAAFLRSEASVARAASALTVHENTVRYRLARFETLTAADLRDARTRAELWWVLSRRNGPRREPDRP